MISILSKSLIFLQVKRSNILKMMFISISISILFLQKFPNNLLTKIESFVFFETFLCINFDFKLQNRTFFL